MSSASDGKTSVLHAQIIAAIMRGPKSRRTLAEELGAHGRTISCFLRVLHDQGVIVRHAYLKENGSDRFSELFAMQATPFDAQDAGKPTC